MANRRFVFSTSACQKLADEEYTVILDDTVPDVAEAELVPEQEVGYENC